MTAKSVLMVPEEITEEIPIGIKAFARDRIARWTYDSSSEESDEELPPYQTAKQLAEAGMLIIILLSAQYKFVNDNYANEKLITSGIENHNSTLY